MADSPYFQVAKSIVRAQQVASRVERLAHLVVAGQCICQEPEQFAFTCPVHAGERKEVAGRYPKGIER